MFYGVTENKMSTVLKRLQADGAQISGNNPWNMVITRKGFDIGIRGQWNSQAQTLLIEVTNMPRSAELAAGLIGDNACSIVWNEMNKHLAAVGVSTQPLPPPQPSRSPGNSPAQQPARQQPAPVPQQAQQNGFVVPTADEVVAAIDRAVAEARQTMIRSLIGQHVQTVSEGWWGSVKKSVKGAGRTIKKTIHKYKGPIAMAAGAAATAAGGPAAGMVAAKMVDAAAGDKSAAKAHEEAKQAAKSDPKLAKALGSAE